MNLDLILPTYNRASLLETCLRSVFRAPRPESLQVTVVVVDNGSTDETRRVVDSFASGHQLPVKYLQVKRPGKSAALNAALRETTADLIGLIDDDEEIDPAWFQIVSREFSDDPGLDYIGGSCVPKWERARPQWFPERYIGVVGIAERAERVPFSRAFGGMLMGGNAVIRNATLQRVLPYPEHLGKIGHTIRSGEDEVIYHRLLDIGAKGMVVPELIIRHWVPAGRLRKRYFRRWVVGRGISVGSQLVERGFDESSILGIPRYMFGSALRGIGQMLSAAPSPKRFTGELSVLDCFATLYGRHRHRIQQILGAGDDECSAGNTFTAAEAARSALKGKP
ncbi:MAG: hypothetical protein NVSMB3_01710 [Acidobacteriaceae bacterium]